jgi:colicin import membrane protein
VTSLGFFDLAIAAPSMKAALAAWGAQSNLFHQGVANQTNDPEVIAATMAHPGIVLRRRVGSDRPFREHAELPKHLSADGVTTSEHRPKKRKQATREIDNQAARKAALAFAKVEGRRPNAGRRKLRGQGSRSAASVQSRRRRQRSKRPNGSMTKRYAISGANPSYEYDEEREDS